MTHNGGLEDAFVAKIVAAGTSLEYCTYIGGSGKDWAWGIAADNSGNAYIVGYATSTEATFPVIVGPGLNHSGIEDAFVAKISHHAFYTFVGFDKPIENEPIVNSAKAGSSIPVKWQITEFDGTPVSDPASFKNLTSYSVNCGAFSVVLTDEVEEYSAGNSGLQYFEDGCWQFNWKTIKSYAGQCRIMVLKLADGSEHTAYFKFK